MSKRSYDNAMQPSYCGRHRQYYCKCGQGAYSTAWQQSRRGCNDDQSAASNGGGRGGGHQPSDAVKHGSDSPKYPSAASYVGGYQRSDDDKFGSDNRKYSSVASSAASYGGSSQRSDADQCVNDSRNNSSAASHRGGFQHSNADKYRSDDSRKYPSSVLYGECDASQPKRRLSVASYGGSYGERDALQPPKWQSNVASYGGGYGERDGYGKRDGSGECDGYGKRNGYGERGGYSKRDGYDERDSYGKRNGYGKRGSYDEGNGYGERDTSHPKRRSNVAEKVPQPPDYKTRYYPHQGTRREQHQERLAKTVEEKRLGVYKIFRPPPPPGHRLAYQDNSGTWRWMKRKDMSEKEKKLQNATSRYRDKLTGTYLGQQATKNHKKGLKQSAVATEFFKKFRCSVCPSNVAVNLVVTCPKCEKQMCSICLIILLIVTEGPLRCPCGSDDPVQNNAHLADAQTRKMLSGLDHLRSTSVDGLMRRLFYYSLRRTRTLCHVNVTSRVDASTQAVEAVLRAQITADSVARKYEIKYVGKDQLSAVEVERSKKMSIVDMINAVIRSERECWYTATLQRASGLPQVDRVSLLLEKKIHNIIMNEGNKLIAAIGQM